MLLWTLAHAAYYAVSFGQCLLNTHKKQNRLVAKGNDVPFAMCRTRTAA